MRLMSVVHGPVSLPEIGPCRRAFRSRPDRSLTFHSKCVSLYITESASAFACRSLVTPDTGGHYGHTGRNSGTKRIRDWKNAKGGQKGVGRVRGAHGAHTRHQKNPLRHPQLHLPGAPHPLRPVLEVARGEARQTRAPVSKAQPRPRIRSFAPRPPHLRRRTHHRQHDLQAHRSKLLPRGRFGQHTRRPFQDEEARKPVPSQLAREDKPASSRPQVHADKRRGKGPRTKGKVFGLSGFFQGKALLHHGGGRNLPPVRGLSNGSP